jgi:fido (protein-threonine AMPylation protein)
MPNLFFSNSTNEAKRLSSLVRKNKLIRVHQGIYTNANEIDISDLILNNWDKIINYLYPNAIIAYRSAHELTPVNDYVVIVTNIKKSKNLKIANCLTLSIQSGDPSVAVEPFLPNLQRSNLSRRLLENLSPSRSTAKFPKTLGVCWVERQLSKELNKYGEASLNKVRDEAKKIACILDLNKEFDKLNAIVQSLLNTSSHKGKLLTDIAIATSKNKPFDENRVILFKKMAEYLKKVNFLNNSYKYNKSAWRNLSFFESYFSNYIEGTKFQIDEAEDVVFQRQLVKNRHKDSHDVLAVFDVVNDYQEMVTVPETLDEFLDLIRLRHKLIMAKRLDKNPGEFKTKNNQAGVSVFVAPGLIEGTLIQAFKEYLQLQEGIQRAIFIHFMVSECHPFDDGNGRLSRIMMNAELTSMEEYKIIVPTVHRDSYLLALRSATRDGNFRSLCKVFYQLQCYTANIDWADYGQARQQLEDHQANLTADEGIATFNRQIRKFKINLPVG